MRLFDNAILEIFSKTPWYGIPLAWIPISIYFFSHNTLPLYEAIPLYFVGVFLWSLIEYLLHRFLFHAEEYWLPSINLFYVIHFTFHGIHHCFPMDRYRLVFPPVPGYILFLGVFFPLYE